LEERGKYRPITMMVGIAPDFTVHGVEVMVYREDRGEEVRFDRFLQQYRDKDTGDPIRTYRDIMNVTGATISVHSVNDGVRRALHTVELLYGGGQETAAAHALLSANA
ncbi:MAG: FMN-binding protein, partial [Gemmatimonadota bacterium]